MMKATVQKVNQMGMESPLLKMTEHQSKLIGFIRSLDGDYRHSFRLTCKGTEPVKIDQVVEHRDADLRR